MPETPVLHVYQTTLGHQLASTDWPHRICITEQMARTAPYVRFSWPYLTIQVTNGRAVYKVGTCDLGVWRGILIESWLSPPA